jgi:6-pyruvoyltetrahydropterin/6-carboxytetrahydropterin synthase
MIHITKKLHFDAAHRLYEYIGKCSNIHGHRYEVFIVVTTECLDSRTISLDFGDIKELFQGWLDENWDHKLILNIHDPLTDFIDDLVNDKSIAGIEKPYAMPCNPTAEGMASYLAVSIFPEILARANINARIDSISVYETPTSSACFVVDKDV